jgi:hypothetical protein
LVDELMSIVDHRSSAMGDDDDAGRKHNDNDAARPFLATTITVKLEMLPESVGGHPDERLFIDWLKTSGVPDCSCYGRDSSHAIAAAEPCPRCNAIKQVLLTGFSMHCMVSNRLIVGQRNVLDAGVVASSLERNKKFRAVQDELDATRALLVDANNKCARMRDECIERAQSVQRAFDDTLSIIKTAHTGQLRDCQFRHDEETRRLREGLAAVHDRYQDQLRKLVDTCDMKAAAHSITESILSLREQQAALQQAVVDKNRSERSDEVSRLMGDLEKLRAENDRLRNSNHVKGVYGETLVRSLLQEHLPSWTYVDTSGVGHHSDFHMVCPHTGRVLAVEVKNKGQVTNGDVDKSMRDARELKDRLGSRLVGYMFVSIRTRNIPKRGSLNLDIIDGIPILWYGASDEDELRASGAELAKLSKLVCAVGASYTDKQHDIAAAHTVVQRARFYMEQLQKQRKVVTSMHGTLVTLKNNMNELLSEVDAMYRDIELSLMAQSSSTAEKDNPEQSASRSGNDDATVDVPISTISTNSLNPQCASCGKHFKNVKLHLQRAEGCRTKA